MKIVYPVTLVCAQPACQYFAWQVEVMLNNFIELGLYHQFRIHLLFAYNKKEVHYEKELSHVKQLESEYSEFAHFFYYEDTREYPISYISSIRPNILKQHFKAHDYLNHAVIFYHDCDIMFSKFPDFLLTQTTDNMDWYVSDTKSYIGYNYIKEKGEDILEKMCEIVGISKEVVMEKQEQSGGCQYIMKGVDYDFFDKMEKDCELMYKTISVMNSAKVKEDPTHHPLQIWTADMWCILWNAWLRGYNTHIIDDMYFSWATDSIENYDKHYIFHNAGVTGATDGKFFYKGDFRNRLPYNNFDMEKIDKTRATYIYAQQIQKVAIKTKLHE